MAKTEIEVKKYLPSIGRREMFAIALLFIEIAVFAFVSDNFFTGENLASVLRNATYLAVVAIGMNIVMLMGGIDISVGPTMGVVAIISGWMLAATMHPMLILPVALLVGLGIGLINGFLISYVRIPDIIATLGTMNILRAAVFAMLGGRWLTGLSGDFSVLTAGSIWGIPIPVYLLIVFFGVFWFILNYTRFGRHIYAIGNSEEAAALSGIPVKRVRMLSYGVLGALVGFASLLYLGRMGSVEITVGMYLHIEAIAAVVLGGTSIKGGSGSVVGTLAGVLFMAVLRNGVVLLGLPSLWERAVIGLLILISVGADYFLTVRQAEKRRIELANEKGLAIVEGASR